MKKEDITLGICTSFDPSYKHYIAACDELGVKYKIVDLLSSDWIAEIENSNCDGFLLRPPCDYQERKTIFDERMYFMHFEMNKAIYPGYKELYIYECKRNMAYWLKINGFPHAETRVFTDRKSAHSYFDQCDFPVVFKSNIGYGAKRVQIVKGKTRAKHLANRVFGLFHPAMSFGYSPFAYHKKMTFPVPNVGKAQKHYLIIQDFKNIKWEWRIIKIGNSYFGHQKLLKGEYASGSGKVGWVKPPDDLLNLAREVSQRGGFNSIALDVFETIDDQYCINEIQSIFGSYNNSQMYIDGKPGRFQYIDGKFVFEEGEFNQHGSYLLRVAHFLEILTGA